GERGHPQRVLDPVQRFGLPDAGGGRGQVLVVRQRGGDQLAQLRVEDELLPAQAVGRLRAVDRLCRDRIGRGQVRRRRLPLRRQVAAGRQQGGAGDEQFTPHGRPPAPVPRAWPP